MGSKAYFAVYRTCLRPGFTFDKRTRRPPRDPVNALLSLGYTLLGEAVATALEVVGLDPYEGFYHADKYGRPALALDLLEEFRGPVADSVVLTLINKRMLQPDDFTEPEGERRRLSEPAWAGGLPAGVQRPAAGHLHPSAGRPAADLSEMPGGAGAAGGEGDHGRRAGRIGRCGCGEARIRLRLKV